MPGREGRTGPPTASKPTQLHAVLAAHARLEKDYETELAAAAAAGHSSAPAEPTAFDALKAAAVARSGLEPEQT